MAWIGIEPHGNIILCESKQTSTWSFITKQPEQATKEAKQMTTEQSVGAASHALDWHQIPWEKVHRNVRRLQARIVKAQQEGRKGKVKALQRLLTHSLSGKALAVRRVTENQGKRTPGVDGETWNTPTEKAAAIRGLRQRGYNPRPLRRTYIPKANGKKRPLGIPTMKDRAMQALYLLAVEPVAEVTADHRSYGFRPERCPADALGYLHRALAHSGRVPEWVLEGDIKSCFDTISHAWLLDHVPMDKAVLQKWLKAGFMEKNAYYRTEEGVPQGGIISPVLANLALDGLEARLEACFPSQRGDKNQLVHYVRYADDFVITGSTKELLEHEVKPLVEQFLKERGLELSQEKTVTTPVKEGFVFLGQEVRRYPNGKVLTKPSKKNTHAFLEKVRGIIETHKTVKAVTLVDILNPVIDGWARYHAFGASKKVFSSVDNAIYEKLWWWGQRRHPQKSAAWQKKKYFSTLHGDNWQFYGEREGRDGKPQKVFLHKASDMPVKRHTLIRKGANPFDPVWEPYFEARLGVKMERHLTGKRQLLTLWKEQDGCCAHCGQKITELTGWHNHHLVWRSMGGSDTQQNRVLLHPNCHRQVHSQGISVAKPSRSRGIRKA
jgi:RNA-directed DNA polymerase